MNYDAYFVEMFEENPEMKELRDSGEHGQKWRTQNGGKKEGILKNILFMHNLFSKKKKINKLTTNFLKYKEICWNCFTENEFKYI